MTAPTRAPAATSGPVCVLEAVRFAYGLGGFALAVPRFELAPGEHVAVIGPSGAGKSTLLHLLAGVLAPASGRVTLLGRSLGDRSDAERRAARAAHVGLVFQELELLEHLTVLDNVLLPYHAVPSLALDAAARARAATLLGRVGLGDKLTRKPRRLSQGERQRVALARALVTEPRLVLGDEPTGNLDPTTSARVVDLLLGESRRTGAALVMVTHDHSLLPRFDRVVDVRDLAEGVGRP